MRNIKSLRAFEKAYDGFLDDNVARLYEILDEMESLMQEANDIVYEVTREMGESIIHERWRVYPYNNIMSLLSEGSEHETSFLKIIEEIEGKGE